MISLYDSREKKFNHNGLVVLADAMTCPVTEELNGSYELALEYPIDTRGKWQHLIEGNIIKADGQLFRIYRKVKVLNSIKVNARHIFYDLMDNFLEDVRPTNLSGSAALDWILTHTQYPHPFINMSDVGGYETRYFIRKNLVEAILGDEGIIATWGGELVRDNFSIKLLEARGLDRGALIAYGKNIQGIEETLDTDGICTRLMPIGRDGRLLPEKYIDSQYIDNYPHPKIKTQEFDIGPDETLGITEEMAIEQLRAAATSYMQDGKIDLPTFNYKIDFLELSKTVEYENYAPLERVYLGDTVIVRHSKLNIDLKAKVIKTTQNVLTNRLEKVELGSFKPNIARSINNSIQDVKKDITQAKTSFQKAVDSVTALLTSALGGYVIKKPGEILIMDTEDEATASKVWRWNLNGFGYSGTGIAGPYETAITMDGHIVAGFISGLLGEFVELRASQIILGDDGEKIPDSLISGADVWNQANQNAEAYANAAQAAAEAYAEVQAVLARTIAQAYTDGIVDAEEQARIDEANANLAEAKVHAESTASAAQAAAKLLSDLAQETADNAQSAADTAQAAADNAASIASQAQEDANAAASNANIAKESADIANNLLSDIADDSKLTAVEKQTVKMQWDAITAEKTILDDQADAYEVVSEKAVYDNYFNVLSNYITPLLSDLSSTSDINGTLFRLNFSNYYSSKTSLLNKITDVAKAIASNAIQPNTSYNNTYITENGLKVKDLLGGEVVEVGALGLGRYGQRVKNASGVEVVITGKFGDGLYGIEASHADGSYTRLTSSGLQRLAAGELKPYHYDTHILMASTKGMGVHFVEKEWTTAERDAATAVWETGIFVYLPNRFKNKDFQCFLSVSEMDIPQGASSGCYMRLEIESIDKVNARLHVIAYNTAYYSGSDGGWIYNGIDFLVTTIL